MSASITIDTSQMFRAIAEYRGATHKDWGEIVNRAAVNVALRTAQGTKKADASAIRDLENQPWWPRFIAKYFRDRGHTFVKTSSAKKFGGSKSNKSTVRHFVKGSSYTVAEARALSRRIIAARVRGITFIRSGWIPAIRLLAPFAKVHLRVTDAKQRGSDKGGATPAKVAINPTAYIFNSVKGAGIVGPAALQSAVSFVAKDMIEYARKKMIETARRHSAK